MTYIPKYSKLTNDQREFILDKFELYRTQTTDIKHALACAAHSFLAHQVRNTTVRINESSQKRDNRVNKAWNNSDGADAFAVTAAVVLFRSKEVTLTK